MPLAVGPDPQNPGHFIWIDAATGQPASQPGGPGTPFIAQSDPSPPTPGAPQGPTTQPQGPAAPGVGTTPRVPGQTGTSIQDVVKSLGPGWTLKDPNAQPLEETAVAQLTDPNTQVTTRGPVGTGNYYVVVKGPDNVERALFLHPDAPPDGTSVKVSGSTDQGKLYSGDLRDLSWTQAKPLGDIPASLTKEPTPSAQLDKLDKNGNDATKSGLPTVTLRDPKTGTTIDLPKDPAGVVTPVGDNFYIVKPDGSSTLVTDASGKPIAKTKDAQQFNVQGIGLVNYDPNTGKATVLINSPTGLQANQLKPEVRNGKTYMPVDDGKGGVVWQEAKDDQGNPLPADVQWTMATNDPRSSVIQLIGSNGESKTIKKEDFHPPPSPAAGTAVPADTNAPFQVTIGDDNKPVYTPNKNQVSILEATRQFIDSLGIHVASGSMTEQQAQDLIKNVTAAMVAQTQQQKLGVDAATGALNAIQQGAQTGAGLLQNRVTAATGGLNNAINAIAGSKMTSAPAGMGANLVGGLQEWVTQLGGGQPVYDSAAAMVNAANPTVKGDPTVAQQAYATLRGAMDLYKQQTGQDWVPKEQRQFTPPTTTVANPPEPNPAGQTTPPAPADPNQWFNAWQQRQAADAAAQRLQAQVQMSPPAAAPSPVVSQNYGPATAYTGGVLPWNAQPGPAIPQLQPLPIPPGPYRAPVTA